MQPLPPNTFIEGVPNDYRLRPTYDPTRTGVLFIDPDNDFLHEDGKLWPMVGDVVTATGTVANMKSVVDTVRDVGIRIVVVPHGRWVDGDDEQWKFPTGTQRGSAHVRLVERDSWGGTFHDDFRVRPGPCTPPIPSTGRPTPTPSSRRRS